MDSYSLWLWLFQPYLIWIIRNKSLNNSFCISLDFMMHFQWLSAPLGWQNKMHINWCDLRHINIEWMGIKSTKAQIQRRHLGAQLALPTPRTEGACRPNVGKDERKNTWLLWVQNTWGSIVSNTFNCRKTIVWKFRASSDCSKLVGIHRQLLTLQYKPSCELMWYLPAFNIQV